MDGIGPELEHLVELERSNKRSLSASPSPSPAIKKARHPEQDCQLLYNPLIHQPTPRSVTRSTVALLENLTSSHPPVEPFERVDDWLEVAYPSELERERLCRSDEFLQQSAESPVAATFLRQVQSVPPMLPPPSPPHQGNGNSRMSTPYSSARGGQQWSPSANSFGRSNSSASGRPSVESPYYTIGHLALNNIYYRGRREPFPHHVSNLIQWVQRPRNSPTAPTSSDVLADDYLAALERGASKWEVEGYFGKHLVPQPPLEGPLQHDRRMPMLKNQVPNNTGTQLKVSNPVPDIICGYGFSAFTTQQLTQTALMEDLLDANKAGLVLPFFILEFKGDGPSGTGSLWVATNQCLGGSAACVNIAERLNRLLRQCQREEVLQVDSTSFSIAANGTEARLFISWKQEERFNVQKVRSFALQEPDQFLEFRKYVRNILDWGRDERLKSIQSALDILIEEGR